MQKYKYFIFFLFINSLLYSQNNYQLSGKVVNENDEPFSNVNIFLSNSKIGTISNSNGEFSLNYSSKEDFITFSYMGYTPYSVEIDSSKKTMRIKLLPAFIELSEVQITNISALQLLQKAISKIPENYSQEEFLVKMFYRAIILSPDDSLLYVEETMFEQLKSYKPNYKDKMFLIKNRNFNFLNKEFGVRGIGIYDNVKSFSHKGWRRNKNVYNYGTPTYFEGRLNYVIEINKDSRDEKFTKGNIFIDVEDLAFVRFELSENNRFINSQYKKIESKYYLFSQDICNQNKSQNGGYGNVKALFVLTEINQTFEDIDIQGTLVNEDEIMRGYTNQLYDTTFWESHNSVLPDTITQRKIDKLINSQELSINETKSKDIEAYSKIYYPNLTLRLSSATPNDIYSLSQNLVSINLFTNNLFQKNFKSIYLKLLVPSIINTLMISPFEEIEVERKLLSINKINSRINPFLINSMQKSYHYGVSQTQIETLKTANYLDFMRLHTLRGEYHYLKTKILEEEIAKADMTNRNNKYDYLTLFFVDLIYNRTYNVFYSQFKDKTIGSIDITKTPLIIDTDKSWVKYLFEQDNEFNSHIKSDMLTTEEKKFLKRSAILSWINLLSPQMLGLSKFSISKNLNTTFSVNYLRIPFGEMTEQNLWFDYKNQLNGLFIRQYINKEKVGYGIGYKMYDTRLSETLSLTSTIDYWEQPANLNFHNNTLKSGFHFGQNLEFKSRRDIYSKRSRLSLFVGYDYKTKGYLPEYLELHEQFKINFGLKINM